MKLGQKLSTTHLVVAWTQSLSSANTGWWSRVDVLLNSLPHLTRCLAHSHRFSFEMGIAPAQAAPEVSSLQVSRDIQEHRGIASKVVGLASQHQALHAECLCLVQKRGYQRYRSQTALRHSELQCLGTRLGHVAIEGSGVVEVCPIL